MSTNLIHVVAAVIYDDGQIVLAKRPDHVHKGGLWEFPGGKVEKDEPVEKALVRELEEELGITPQRYRPLIQIPHHYPEKSVLLDVWLVEQWRGELHGREGQLIRSVSQNELNEYQFPEANAPIVKACQLPEHYLITPNLNGDDSNFIDQLKHSLQPGIQLVQFRQSEMSPGEFRSLAKQVIDICHQGDARVLLNSDVKIAAELGADGVHLNSHRLMQTESLTVADDFLVAASCHSTEELKHAADIGSDFAVLGSVLETTSHPGQQPLGWGRFAQMVNDAIIPTYALGGMERDMVDKAQRAGGQGIAAISALWKA